MGRHEGLSEYGGYCNEERLHDSLDIDGCKAPSLAFGSRKATEPITKSGPKWMESDLA